MDLPSQSLDSLVSAVSGMDRKGVPVKGSEDLIKTSQSFENELRRQDVDRSRNEARSSSSDRDMDRSSRSEKSEAKKKDSSKEASQSDRKSSSKKATVEDSAKDKATIEDERDVELLAKNQTVDGEVLAEGEVKTEAEEVSPEISQPVVKEESDQEIALAAKVLSEETPDKEAKAKLSEQELEAEMNQKVVEQNEKVVAQVQQDNQKAQVNVQAKGERPELSAKLAQQQTAQASQTDPSQKSSKAKTSGSTDPELEKALKKLESVKDVKTLSRETTQLAKEVKASAFDQELADYEETQLNLKQLANKLWLQRNLSGEKADFVQTKFEPVLDKSNFEVVRKNFVEDVQPLVKRVMQTKEGGQMTVSLRPGNLGRVKLDVQVQNDQVRVELHAEKAATRTIMKDQVVDLKRTLQSAGLKAEEVTISQLRPEQANQERDSNNQKQNQNNQNQDSREQSNQQEGRNREGHRDSRQQARQAFQEAFVEKEVA